MGGNVAGVYAACYPSEICSMTLICPDGQSLHMCVSMFVFVYICFGDNCVFAHHNVRTPSTLSKPLMLLFKKKKNLLDIS